MVLLILSRVLDYQRLLILNSFPLPKKKIIKKDDKSSFANFLARLGLLASNIIFQNSLSISGFF